MGVQQEIEDAHARLAKLVSHHLGPDDMTISIATINDRREGQMILANPEYDKKELARRLRLCADILDGK